MRSVFRTIVLGALAAPALWGCQAGQQPEACEAFLVCFYPENEQLSPDFEDDRPQSDSLAEDAQAAFGSEGECWKNGSGDRFHQICERTCRDVIHDECTAEELRPCVRVEDGERLFDPPEWEGVPLSCSDFDDPEDE